jgi:capsid portal protein
MISKGPVGDRLTPAPAVTHGAARSFVTRGRTQASYSSVPTSYPLLGLRSPGTIRDRHRQHQAERQTKADDLGARVSHARGPAEFATIIGGYAEPPFDLNMLTELLFESDVYYAIVDQFAIDTASGWKLHDKSDGEEAQLPINEIQQSILRQTVERALDLMCYDFDDQRVSLATFSQLLLKDKDSTGNAHNEIVRGPDGKPVRYIHVPARLVRRGIDGRTFVQIDEEGRPQAFFRRYGAEVRPINPETGESDTPWAYLNRDEAATIAGTLDDQDPVDGQRLNDLKRELTDFKTYHPAERYYGIPPIVSAFNSLVGNILASNRNVRFFINRGMPDYAVMIKAPADAFKDPDIEQNIISRIEETIEEHMKYMIEGEDHRTLTLRCLTGDFEVEFKELGGEPSDQEWGGYQETNRDNIIHVYRMLPEKIGIIETASLGTGSGESQDETYKRSQIEPRQLMLEAFWDNQLVELGARTLEFRYDDIDVLDEQREASTLVAVASTGALSINDIRAWASRIVKDQDFPPEEEMEGADVPLKLLDLQIAGMGAGGAGEQPLAPAPPQAGRQSGMLTALAGLAGQGRRPEPPPAEESLMRIRQGTGSVQNGARRALDRRRLAMPAGNGNGRR